MADNYLEIIAQKDKSRPRHQCKIGPEWSGRGRE